MTDLELFKQMLSGSDSEDLHGRDYNYGPTISITLKILGGTAGSEESFGEAFFDSKTGKFLAIHHCD